MDGDSWPLIFAFVFFVIFGAYFAGAESAYTAMNTIKLKAMAGDGNKRAKKAMLIASDFDRALTTLLIGNNLTHIAASSLATVIFMRIWGTAANTAVYSTFVTTAVVFLFCEMIPKSYANDRSETMALFCASSLRFFMKVLYPFAKFFMWVASFFSGLISSETAPTVTEEELHDIIDTIEEEGVLDEDESDLIKSALDFPGTVVKDIMTMKGDMSAINADISPDDAIAFIRGNTHSRIPVYEGTIDNIVGTLLVREYVKSYLRDKTVTVRSLMNEAMFTVPEMPIDDLLNHMRQHRIYLSIVRDSEGRTLGLVTIEDFLEELVGEIWDEDDVVDKDFVKLGGNRFMLSPKMKVSEAFLRIGYVPKQVKPFMQKPIISWIVETLRHIPQEEESFIFEGLEVTVEEMDGNTVESVVIRRLEGEEQRL